MLPDETIQAWELPFLIINTKYDLQNTTQWYLITLTDKAPVCRQVLSHHR